MTFAVKEIFYSLQGEGAHAGRPSVFCRFAGCNLWSGREEDRADAVCAFCDTDFVGVDGLGGGKFDDAERLSQAIAAHWPDFGRGKPYVVLTGGEPLLQVTEDLIQALHAKGFEVAIETNGTQKAPKGLDWICLSPKAGADIVLDRADEVKLVYPQDGVSPEQFEHFPATHHFLQPLDGPAVQANIQACIQYCQKHPHWHLSLQTHKLTGIR